MLGLTISKSRAWRFVLLVVMALCGEPCLADDEPAVQQLPQGWPTLQSLLKLPSWMSLELELTGDTMAGMNPTLNPAADAAWIQQLVIDSSLSRGLSKPQASWTEFDHWGLNLQLTTFSGNPNLYLPLGAAFPLQSSAHPVGLWLTEASLERSAGNGNLDVKAGLLPLNPGFVESPVLDTYIHSVLNNTLNLAIPGLPINPFVAPGAEVDWQLTTGQSIRIGGYWLDAQTALASMLGVNPIQPDVQGTLQIVQWNLSNLPGSQAAAAPIRTSAGLIARQLPAPLLQLGAFTTTASSELYPSGVNQGIYGSLTLSAPLAVGLDNRIWLGFNSGLNSTINPFPLAIMGGWLNQGLIPGRPFDVLAVGLGRTSFSPQLSPGTFEGVVELNYAINLNAQLTLQPVIQWIINPGGGNAGDGAIAGGLQVSLSF